MCYVYVNAYVCIYISIPAIYLEKVLYLLNVTLDFSTAHLFLTITRCFGSLSETIFRKRCLYTQNTAWEVNDWTARQLPSVSEAALGCFTVFISPLVTVQCVRC